MRKSLHALDSSVVKRETIQRVATPTAILIGVPEPLGTACTEALNQGGLRVLKVGHVAAACERIPVVMPQLVVTGPISEHESELLADRCVAVGADVFRVEANPDEPRLRERLKDAATVALIRSMRQSIP